MAPVLLHSLLGDPASATMPPSSGLLPAPVAEAFRAGLFNLPEHAVPTATSVGQDRWHVPVLMVGFSDAPLTITAAEFETALFDTTGAMPNGSVSEYYRWASAGRARISGQVIAVVNLPMPRSFYAYGFYGLSKESTPQNLYGMVRDALLTSEANVDWSRFDINHDGIVDVLWVVHQGVGGETGADRTNLWSVTSRMSAGWSFGASFPTNQRIPGTMNSFYQVDRFSTLPELSAIIPGRRAEIGVFCHEFGHVLGLPDLYDTTGFPAPAANVGPGNWSLMATGGYGGGGLTPERPTHLGAWCTLFLGWTQSIRPAEDTLITLRPIARGDPVLEVWFQGESKPEHFIIENRSRESFDTSLPNSGLVIYHVDEGVISQRLNNNNVNAGTYPGLVLLEGDGDGDLASGANRGDPADPLPGSLNRTAINDQSIPHLRTFGGASTNLALGSIERLGVDVRFQLQVRAPGWGTAEPVGAIFGAVLDSGRPGRWARTDAQRRVWCVRSEWVDGRPQIVLQTRLGNLWQPAEVVSASPAPAFDPSIACLPGGDLAVAWTDLRGGRSRIYLRQRVRGRWQAEALLSEMEGDSHHPAIGADSQGMVQVAWLTDDLEGRRIYFKRFAYISPSGMSSPVTAAGESPDPPALEVRPNGSSYLVWSDRAGLLPRLYFARFHPDSGVSLRVPLTPTPGAAQLGASLAVDGAGDLHVAWQVAGSGLNELHYQRRRAGLIPAPRDTMLDASGYLLQNPSITCDDSGGVHLIYENWGTQVPVPSYRLWTAARGWDAGGTALTTPGEGGIYPVALPHSTSDVTTLFTRETGFDLQLVERRRRLGIAPTLAAPPTAPPGMPGWQLAPNPLRAGAVLRLAARGAGTAFEIFDLGGRRMAEVPCTAEGGWRRASIPAALTAGWPGGVYFVRLRGGGASLRFVVLR
ncbi:MAG: M6 family metalloprotease domain-containing protein [Candidatus Eisenbacteria bacterium]